MTTFYKILRVAAFFLIAILLLLLIYQNNARFLSAADEQKNAESLIGKYVSEGQSGNYDCRVRSDEGFPQRYPKKISEIFISKQKVWSFTWKCTSANETVNGILVVYSDGNTVWQGKSSTRGDLATEEY